MYAKTGIRVGGGNDADIIVRDPAAYSALALDGGELGLGRAFEDGLWDEGRMTVDEFTFKRVRGRLFETSRTTDPSQQSIEGSRRIVELHYDNIRIEVFRAFLDPYMQYTCGLFYAGAKNLAEAQLYKMRLLGLKMRLKAGETVLDIGGGWGGLAKFLVQHFGVRVIIITISKEQAAFAREFCKGLPVEVLELDYRQLLGRIGLVDHIVSVGMIEHVGPAHYAEFFDICRALLMPGGDFLLHSIFGLGTNAWLEANIFPGGELSPWKGVEKVIQGRFHAADWHFFGRDYDTTLMEWDRNLEDAKPGLIGAEYDERFFRTMKYYFRLCQGFFRTRAMTVGQVHLFREAPSSYELVR